MNTLKKEPLSTGISSKDWLILTALLGYLTLTAIWLFSRKKAT